MTARRRRRPELALLVGLQASGKSTFARQCFPEHVHLGKDLMSRSARNKDARLAREVGGALSEGRSVVVDNTQPHPDDRAALIALGRAAGARVTAYFFPTPLEVARARNARRIGRARVPEIGLIVAARRLRVPTRDEGFDALFEVRLEDDGAFTVRRLRKRG